MPGMDGTGLLFAPLQELIGGESEWRILTYRILTYARDRALSYEQLAACVAEQLAGGWHVVLLAESFSGPLGLRYAIAHPQRVRAVVLISSFVQSPMPRWITNLAATLVRRAPIGRMAIRMLLVGWCAPPTLVKAVLGAIWQVDRRVLAVRLKAIGRLDCGDLLVECRAPVLLLCGSRDVLVGRRAVRRMLALRSELTVRIIDGPHLLLQSSPAEAWREIRAFLAGLS
jgi:pimeloyl-ACP methyl ester carboxylesterase